METAPAKERARSLVMTHKMVNSAHMNRDGLLLGSYLMCWMDEAAFMCARQYSDNATCVSLRMDHVTFQAPINLGDHVVLSAWVNAIGRTSLQIEVRVEQEDPLSGIIQVTNSAFLTFACLSEASHPDVNRRLMQAM